MRCCVQNCNNDDTKKTNKSQGITFHKLPKDPDQCAAWVEVLASAGCRQSKRLVICSEHFNAEDFDETRPNQRRVRSGAVPIMMAPDNQSEIKVCRVCLAVDDKMYEMKEYKINEMFQNITGILACNKNKSILQRLCWECAARLKAASAFRDKALFSDSLLKDLENINDSDIEILKKTHSTLNSPLGIKTHFFSFNNENEETITENKNIQILLNYESDVKERKTALRMAEEDKEAGYEEYEPWIDVPMKTEIESDPIAENNVKDRQGGRSYKPTHYNDNFASRDDSEDDTINTEELIDNEDMKMASVPIYDGHIGGVDDKEKESKIGVIGNIAGGTSSEEDVQSTADDVSGNKAKDQKSSDDKTTKKRVYKLNERIKEQIIELKRTGFSVRAIAQETGMTVAAIDCWWSRYRRSCNAYRGSHAAGRNAKIFAQQNYAFNQSEPGKEMGACSPVVRQRLYEAGLEHILMKKPDRAGTVEVTVSKHKALHDDLKQRIIALKQEGVANGRIAYLLDTSRITVRKWWSRWCEEGHMQNLKHTGRKRKTTTEEDQILIDRVAQEQTVHTPSLAKELGISPECVRRRLKEAGFKHKERTAYVPLKQGRSHEVDEGLKQHIISMKLNGVSVTDISNQFRVPRTTIYQWWQRWCKENNMNVSSNNNRNTAFEQGQGLPEDANGERSVQTPSIISSQKTLWEKLPEVVEVKPYTELE